MIADFFKNSSPMTFYIISIISFFIANYVGNKNLIPYLLLLAVGLLFFVLGILKRFRSR
jgi:hypothetical protein